MLSSTSSIHTYVSVTFLTILFPLIQLCIFAFRFRYLPISLVLESIVFLPVGFLSALFFLFLLTKAQKKTHKMCIFVSYVVAVPLACITSLAGGLVMTPLIGVTLFGFIPFVVIMGSAYFLGKTFF